MDIQWNSLHDSSIKEISIDWEREILTIEISTTALSFPEIRRAFIKAENVTSLLCPMKSPWGKSKSINEVKQIGKKLKIEMQSGDTIVIEATLFKLEEF
ncbi:hypothetical protein [Rufibacter hautae]|uniref:Uncharacterized protein n=1 Tax=Rufibacter hautae TaxID=2595005 RepID=A0A5B6THL6_9BACT|nr:hypothetical protein [Rufibacter hautae]KAA3439753.1 hypothetical protein FOA19_03490 [Rufibacter hautae]